MKQEWFIVACVVLGMVSFSCAINPCASDPCSYRGVCWEDEQSTIYKCFCYFRYSGVNCEIPVSNLVTNYSSVSQSSTIASADLALDGDYNPYFLNGSCSMTSNKDVITYWEVVLKKPSTITNILITHEQSEGCFSDLGNLDIFVDNKTCETENTIPIEGHINVHVVCDPPVTGQTVRFQAGANMNLILCEVEMYP